MLQQNKGYKVCIKFYGMLADANEKITHYVVTKLRNELKFSYHAVHDDVCVTLQVFALMLR